ncbi:hypothetical protein [Haloplanus pelagicus]|uniref:hypothetical protein n=1 Tax=Haloplanus pelagicus TaxID=2949995 RepID=UPI00203D790F|nr:hypothetical protein [Haloplanus sp. HW8-1]
MGADGLYVRPRFDRLAQASSTIPPNASLGATEAFWNDPYASSTIPPNASLGATEAFWDDPYASSTIPPNASLASAGTSKSW